MYPVCTCHHQHHRQSDTLYYIFPKDESFIASIVEIPTLNRLRREIIQHLNHHIFSRISIQLELIANTNKLK